jgi:hypothetical protein
MKLKGQIKTTKSYTLAAYLYDRQRSTRLKMAPINHVTTATNQQLGQQLAKLFIYTALVQPIGGAA